MDIDTQHSNCSPDLKGDCLAYVTTVREEGDAVVVRNLVTGITNTLRGDAREKIVSIVLTSRAVAFVTFGGYLYVAELRKDRPALQTHRVQLPSSSVQALSGHNGTIVLAMRQSGVNNGIPVTILIYDIGTHRLQSYSFEAAKSPPGNRLDLFCSRSIVVDSDRKTVNVFTLVRNHIGCQSMRGESAADDTEHLYLTHVRISFSGVVTEQQERTCPIVGKSNKYWMNSPQPTGVEHEYRIEIMGGVRDGYEVLPRSVVAFDVLTMSLTPVKGLWRSFWPFNSELDGDEYSIERMRAEWKGLTLSPSLPALHDAERWASLMNDTFFVSFEENADTSPAPGYTSIQVFCFDKKVDMPDAEDLGYWS